jgi:putative ABC transport system substrate-binding protein
MIARRALIGSALAGAAAWPIGAAAQQRTARVGWLSSVANPQIAAFRTGMAALGYTEGRNLVIEVRDAAGSLERLPALARELERARLDVLVTIGFVATMPAREHTSNLPIVFVSNDSVELGFADSLARPGGRMTGVELLGFEINAKWVEMLVELLPGATRFAALEALPSRETRVQGVHETARSLGKTVTVHSIARAEELDDAFASIAAARAEGLLVLPSAVLHGLRARITALAERHRLPAVYEHSDFAEAGGLMSYGADIAVMFRRLAHHVDLILRGVRPGDIPVEQPTKLELVINLKTARRLGLAVPESLLVRADEVIE